MNVMIQPNTNCLNTPSLSKSLTMKPKIHDRFVTCFGKAKPLDISSFVTFTENDKKSGDLDANFKARSEKSIQTVLSTLPSALKDDVLEQFQGISVANNLPYCQLTKGIHPDEIKKSSVGLDEPTFRINLLMGIMGFLRGFARNEEDKVSMDSLETSLKYIRENQFEDMLPKQVHDYPIAKSLFHHIKTMADRYKDGEDISNEDLAHLFCLKQAWSQLTPYLKSGWAQALYLGDFRQILIFGEYIQEEGETQPKRVYHNEKELTRIVRHETWHAISDVARNKIPALKRYKRISDHPVYQKLLKRALKKAKSNGNLDKVIENQVNRGTFTKERLTRYEMEEAFVEIGASLTGGGRDVDGVNQIYQEPQAWVKHNVLMPYERPAFLKNPFRWLDMTFKINCYNLKTRFNLAFK